MKAQSWKLGRLLAPPIVLVLTSHAWAADALPFNTGDTAWMLTSTALVLMMTVPALALFYGGLVRSKNVLSTFMHSLFCAGLISVTWVLFGYSLAFGTAASEGTNLFIGGLSMIGLKGTLNTAHPLAGSIPQILFAMFQMTFAIITPALISGTFAERIRFPAFAAMMFLWSTLIYLPLCHWVWGGGWIGTKVGALDFAGGTVVHISSGISALVTAIYLGKRLGYGHEPMAPHNLPFTVVGAALLWFGWFGFNAGSACGSNELAAIAFANTNTAAAAAALGWMAAEWFKTGKPTILGAASGVVAGLVCITPAAGFVTPLSSILFGVLAGVICYAAVNLKPRLGYDDALDVVGVHMVGGTLGALLTGLFATKAINPTIALEGGAALLTKQLIATVATYGFCGLGTLVILVVVDKVFGLRASHEEEIPGLDISQHSERGYHIGTSEAVAIVGTREPKPANLPPISWDRFTAVVEGIEPGLLIQHWRSLCQDTGSPPSPQFRVVYSNVSTIRENKFRFRSGDPEKIRQNLEQLFKPVSPTVSAKIEKIEERAYKQPVGV